MNDIRQRGKIMLATVINKPTNVKVFEQHLFDKIGKDEETYFWSVYQIVGLLLSSTEKSKQKMGCILNDINENKIGWNSSSYQTVSTKIEEFDQYLVHPVEVVEGVTKCPKCHKSKTWSIQKQTRSSDEPMTTFSRCVDCGHQWAYAG